MSITDVLGGLNGAAAVLAALVHHERTGEGQQIWVDLLGSALAALSEHLVHMLNNGADGRARVTPMHGHGYIPPPYGFYATKDGYLALSSGRQIREICEIVGLPDLSEDPRFDTYSKRAANQGELEAILEDALRARTTDEWLAVIEPADIFAAHRSTRCGRARWPIHRWSVPQRVLTVDSPDGPLRLVAPPPAVRAHDDRGPQGPAGTASTPRPYGAN